MLGPSVLSARSHFIRIALLRLSCLSDSLWLRSCPCQTFQGLRRLARIGPVNNVVHVCARQRFSVGNDDQDIHEDHSQGQYFSHDGLLGWTRLSCLHQSIACPLTDGLLPSKSFKLRVLVFSDFRADGLSAWCRHSRLPSSD